MATRINEMRLCLYGKLIEKKTPGDWNHILNQIGMFSYTGLTKLQSETLVTKFEVYLTNNGRISMAGLNMGMDRLIFHHSYQ